jgi:hypothetical protein
MPIGSHRLPVPIPRLDPTLSAYSGTDRQYARPFFRATALNCRSKGVVCASPAHIRSGAHWGASDGRFKQKFPGTTFTQQVGFTALTQRRERDIVMGYPTTEELREWFRLHEQGQAAKFFELYVRDDVKWTVMVFSISILRLTLFSGDKSNCGCISFQGCFSLWNSWNSAESFDGSVGCRGDERYCWG